MNSRLDALLKPGDSFRDLDCGPEMVVVPAGEFWMGRRDEEGSPAALAQPKPSAAAPKRLVGGRFTESYEEVLATAERPRHKVTLARPFAVGRYPVTFDEWEAALAAGGAGYNPSDQGRGRGRRPVFNVSWIEVQVYIEWLSAQTGQAYRLPSDAEWEYCCRAGSEAAYCFGGDEGDLGRYAWYSSNSNGNVQPVGEKLPNKFGLYDMHGNVCEWCQDWWNFGYAGAPADGSPWMAGYSEKRVARGGAWSSPPGVLRSGVRTPGSPDFYCIGIGFRLARTLAA